MKTIKFYVLHPYCKDVDSAIKYLFLDKLRDKYNFVWTPDFPDYLITTEHIYNTADIREQYKFLQKKAKIIIFYTREAVSPDFNLCDYAIGFDSDLVKGDRYIQLPTAFDLFPAFLTDKENIINTVEKARIEIKKKNGFCSFLYSNHMAHPNRDKLFFILSSYKRVDSLGRHLNNVSQKGTGYKGHENSCVEIKSPYKFSISSENACFNGYTSEKLLTSLAAHSVPIYFGDPDVEQIINPKCFINCNKLHDIEEVIDIVKMIDNDENLWCEMVSQPWQTPEQETLSRERLEAYYAFFKRIFDQGIDKAKRRPEGCRPDMYRYQFFKEKIHKVPFFVLVYRRIMKSYIKKYIK